MNMRQRNLLIAMAIGGTLAVVVFFMKGDRASAPVMLPANEEFTEEGGETFNPISIPALANKQFDGRDLEYHQVLADNSVYTRYYITYKSGDLKISGIMNIPKGSGPFPVLVLNHGYIDPAIYTNGRGLKREQDYLARRGYIVIHPDYRNHAESDKDPDADVHLRLGYVEDVINAVYAVKNSNYEFFNKEKIGMLGHSMGGGVTINTLVVQPSLVSAAVLFAPVSADATDNFKRWTTTRPQVAEKIVETFGSPETSVDFWHDVSAINFLDRIQAPILLHHGTADESVPIAWSENLDAHLKDASKDITYYIYEGQPHEFTTSWSQVMQRTADFFDSKLK